MKKFSDKDSSKHNSWLPEIVQSKLEKKSLEDNSKMKKMPEIPFANTLKASDTLVAIIVILSIGLFLYMFVGGIYMFAVTIKFFIPILVLLGVVLLFSKIAPDSEIARYIIYVVIAIITILFFRNYIPKW